MQVLIPARYGATRLPGKPLRDVAGRPLIVRVYERACQSEASRVVVVTDDERVARVITAVGGEVVMTSRAHESGTDRLAEAATRLALDDDEIVVNVQGDEPLMPPSLITAVSAALDAHADWSMATAAYPIATVEEFESPHVVKVVCSDDQRALYFSRAPVPWPRTPPIGAYGLHHIGLYAYRVAFLRRFAGLKPAMLERREGLEQLRALAHGATIGVITTPETPGPGVDTEADLVRVNRLWDGLP